MRGTARFRVLARRRSAPSVPSHDGGSENGAGGAAGGRGGRLRERRLDGGADGLGHMMAVAYRTLDTSTMYVAIIAVSLLGYVLDRGVLVARGRLLVWRAEEG
jgi:hypothetical protein